MRMNTRTSLVLLMVLAALLCAREAGAHGGMADLSVYDRTDGRRLAV